MVELFPCQVEYWRAQYLLLLDIGMTFSSCIECWSVKSGGCEDLDCGFAIIW